MIRKVGPEPGGYDDLEVRKEFLKKRGFLLVEQDFPDTAIDLIRERLKGLLIAKDFVMFLDHQQRIHLAFHQAMDDEKKEALLSSIHQDIVAEDRQQTGVSLQGLASGIVFLQREAYKKTLRQRTPRNQSRLANLLEELQIFAELEFEDLELDSDQS